MKTLLIAILALINLQLSAQTWVEVPDTNFQSYLLSNYPAGAFTTNGASFFIDSDHPNIQNEDSLDVHNLAIWNLDGMQAFENLLYLDCGYNSLSYLPDLPAGLQVLICESNQLLALPELPLGLAVLKCSYNYTSTLPDFPQSLNLIECINNQLSSLPTLPISLITLQCSSNDLYYLPDLPPYLEKLYCIGNALFELPDLPQSLKELGCQTNQLTALPTIPDSLELLDCAFNELTEIPVLPVTLKKLICNENQLTDLPVLPPGMTHLACYINSISELPELPQSLVSLLCYQNDISCFSPFPASLEDCLIENNPFSCLPNYLPVMDSILFTSPLCHENDPVNNPNNCVSAINLAGSVFHDVNTDCLNPGQGLNYVPILVYNSSGELVTLSRSQSNGDYFFAAGQGAFNLCIDTVNLSSAVHVVCPVGNMSTVIIPTADTVVSGGDFGLNCSGFDLGVQSIVTSGWVFPGQTHQLTMLAGDMTLQYQMNCAEGVSGEVSVDVSGPGTATFLGSPISVNGNSAVYAVADFGTTNLNEFLATVLTDTTATSSDFFCVSLTISTNVSGELDSTNNEYKYCYNVINSYDPNIKETYPEIVEPGYTDEFTYTIHFQNTGSAPAFNIRLADTLDANLDLSTFKVVTASHNFTTNLNTQNRLLTVRFPNIMLPDSTSDHAGSIGYIQYRVKPVPGLTDGTEIHNTAFIYFDYNTPIVTNTTENLFSVTAGLKDVEEQTVQLYPNPSDKQVFVRVEKGGVEQILMYDLNGTIVYQMISDSKQLSIDVSNLKAGVYLVTVQTNESAVTKRLIVR